MTELAAISSPGAIALIGATAGVLGGVLGALAGGWSTYRIEALRQRFQRRRDLRAELRERERDRAIVRGIARVWRTRFDDLVNLIDWALEEPVGWWGDEQDVDTGMSVDDMKAVAAALDRDRWDQIDVGLSAVRAVRAERTRFLTSEDKDLEFTAEDRATLADYRESIVEAMQALESMSEALPEAGQSPYWAREDF